MTYQKMLKLGVLIYITYLVLMWIHGSLSECVEDLFDGIQDWPQWTLAMLAVSVWGMFLLTRYINTDS